jgi:hypothetical protein
MRQRSNRSRPATAFAPLAMLVMLFAVFAPAAIAEELPDPHSLRRDGSAHNENFGIDGVDDYRLNADIAILHEGPWSLEEPLVNVTHLVDCEHPDPWAEYKETYIPPVYESPDWQPDEFLAEELEPLPQGPYGCHDNHMDTTIPVTGPITAHRGTDIDGRNSSLGGLGAGVRLWGIRTGGVNFAMDRNPLSDPEHPEYDPEAPKYLPEVGLAHTIAGFDWVANHSGAIEVAYLQSACPLEEIPLHEAFGEEYNEPWCNDWATMLRQTIEPVIDKGVVVVAAAGERDEEVSFLVPQNVPDLLTVSAVRDGDGLPGGHSEACSFDDELWTNGSSGPLVDMTAPVCGDSGGGSSKVAAAAAALASECPAADRAGVEYIVDTLMAEGDTRELQEGGWKDTSGDAWKEPLLDLRNEEVFNPVLESTGTHEFTHEPEADCPWRSYEAEADVDSDGRADLVALNPKGESAEVFAGTYEGPYESPRHSGYEVDDPNTSLEGQLDPALLDGEGSYAIDTADVDGDRHADLITAQVGGGVRVLAGDGDGQFAAGVSSLPEISIGFRGDAGECEPIAVADVDDDGLADLVAHRNSDGAIVTYPGKGNATFGAPVVSELGLDSSVPDRDGEYFLDVADVTGEELDDPEAEPIDYFATHTYADLVASDTDGTAYVYPGGEDGSFGSPVVAAEVDPIFDDGNGEELIGLGDVDRDRRADLLTLDGDTLILRKAEADGTFEESVVAYEGEVDSSLLDGEGKELIGLLDYSRDGLADLVAITEQGEALTYLAQRDATFAAPVAQKGTLSSSRKQPDGNQFVAEKPYARQAGCLSNGCDWPAATFAVNADTIAAYSFDEGAGTTLGDSAGNHDGTIEGGAAWTEAGKYGSALDFDGTNDLVSITDANDLDLEDAFTLEAWVHPDTLKGGAVITKLDSSGGKIYGYSVNSGSDYTNGKPGGSVGNSSGTTKEVLGPSSLPTESWSHLAFTSDGETLRFYVDGQLVATETAVVMPATIAKLKIGKSVLGYFNGLIDEVRIYDAPLSEAEIQADRDTPI